MKRRRRSSAVSLGLRHCELFWPLGLSSPGVSWAVASCPHVARQLAGTGPAAPVVKRFAPSRILKLQCRAVASSGLFSVLLRNLFFFRANPPSFFLCQHEMLLVTADGPIRLRLKLFNAMVSAVAMVRQCSPGTTKATRGQLMRHCPALRALSASALSNCHTCLLLWLPELQQLPPKDWRFAVLAFRSLRVTLSYVPRCC